MTCLVVMQPTVLPWSGYFNLISTSDIFVFHDDIQLEKQSWQTRNKLIFDKKEAWITTPIMHEGENQKIIATNIMADKKWALKSIQKFHRNYSGHPFYEEGFEIFQLYINSNITNLAQRNEETIRLVCQKLNINKNMYRASDLKLGGVRTEKLINLCDYFKASKYLSPIGSKTYLEIDNFTSRTSTKLDFQNYSPKPYPQKGMTNFISHLSIIDVICNLGFTGASSYIKSN